MALIIQTLFLQAETCHIDGQLSICYILLRQFQTIVKETRIEADIHI